MVVAVFFGVAVLGEKLPKGGLFGSLGVFFTRCVLRFPNPGTMFARN
jgi:hypothetical protein